MTGPPVAITCGTVKSLLAIDKPTNPLWRPLRVQLMGNNAVLFYIAILGFPRQLLNPSPESWRNGEGNVAAAVKRKNSMEEKGKIKEL